MHKKISALNTDWNRKLDFLDDERFGIYLMEKNGMALFAWHYSKHNIKYFKCEESVFTKNFRYENEEVKFDFDFTKNQVFEKYPF